MEVKEALNRMPIEDTALPSFILASNKPPLPLRQERENDAEEIIRLPAGEDIKIRSRVGALNEVRQSRLMLPRKQQKIL